MKRNYLQVEDIIADEGFQSWYFSTNTTLAKEWESWMANHREKASLVEEARLYMDSLSIEEKELPQQLSATAEQQFRERLRIEKETGYSPKTGRVGTLGRWWWAAAAVIVLSISAITLWSTLKKPDSVHTQFGEIREQHLPDGSIVMLNANSEITY